MSGNEYGRSMRSAPGAATEGTLPLRKAKQPAKTSKNQTNVRRAGRQTIAITH